MCGKANLPPPVGVRGWLCRALGYWMSLSPVPCPHRDRFNNSFPVPAALQALQACVMGRAGAQSPQMMMEGHTRPQGGSWCLPMGLVSCAAPQAGEGRVSSLLHGRLGVKHLHSGRGLWQRFVPQGCRARSRHQWGWPDLPLQHQQPRAGHTGGTAWSPSGPPCEPWD